MAQPDEAQLLREFIQEMTLRIERGGQAIAKELAGLRKEIRDMRGEMGAGFSELHQDNRAQHAALLHILDRLDNGGAPAA